MLKFQVNQNRKLSKYIVQNCSDISYSVLMKLLRQKDIKINGKRISEDVELAVGDSIEIYYNPTIKDKFNLIFEDENIIVLDKKSGYTSEEIFQSVLQKYANARFIHRLDRNTSGIMIFALNEDSERELLKGFKERTFDKKYLAQVYGKMPKNKDVLIAYLVKDQVASEVKIYNTPVKNSVQIKTGYQVLSTDEHTSVLQVTLYTGKTHQIRAHLAYEGHFIIGDGKYGNNVINKQFKAKTQRLISYKTTLFFSENQTLFYLNGKTFTSQFKL